MSRYIKVFIIFFLMSGFCLIFSKNAFSVSDNTPSQVVYMRAGSKMQNGINLLFKERVIETEIAGKKCIATNTARAGNFIGFDVSDSFIFGGDTNEAILTVEYFDIGEDTFAIQYDSSNIWPYEGGFARAGKIIKKQDTKTWKRYTTRIKNVRFSNRQGYGPASRTLSHEKGSDFRINNRSDGNEYVSYVEVKIPYMMSVPTEFGNIFETGQQASILLNINNKESRRKVFALEYRIVDFYNNAIIIKEDGIEVQPNTILPYDIKIGPDEKGIFVVYINLYNAGKIIESHSTSFALCDKSLEEVPYRSPFGVATPLLWKETSRTIKMMKRLNINWVRQTVRPYARAGQKDHIDWGRSDLVVRECYENGINICAVILGGNIPNPTAKSYDAIERFVSFVAEAARKYNNIIKYWEVWNEPDAKNSWPRSRDPKGKTYAKFLRACYTEIKSINADSQVLIGGLTGSAKNRFWYLSQIYKNKGKNYFDIAAIHPYTAPDSPEKNNILEKKIEDAAVRLKRNGDVEKNIWITELGYPTSKGSDRRNISLEDQANFLVRSCLIAISHPDVEKIFWHCLRNIGVSKTAMQQNFGLINNDFTPKPAAIAYFNLINKTADLNYIGRLDLNANLRGYIFGKKDKRVKILWSLEEDEVLVLPVKGSSVLITDIMGNTKYMQSQKGKARILLTDSPIFLEEDI